MDGTLVESERLWAAALADLAVEYGGRLSTAARLSMVGVGVSDSMLILHAALGQPWRDPAVSVRLLEDRMVALLAAGLDWRPGARRLLATLRAAGIPTALVTSTSRRLVEVAMSTLGPDNFDVVVCGDEVSAAKPDPAPYLLAARLLGVPVAGCVAVEDSPAGVASARQAGAAVLAVPHEVPLPDVDGVHLVSSLTAVDVALLAGLPRPAADDLAVVALDRPVVPDI